MPFNENIVYKLQKNQNQLRILTADEITTNLFTQPVDPLCKIYDYELSNFEAIPNPGESETFDTRITKEVILG